MSSYNKIILLGNITRDIKLNYTTDNIAVADFGLATNRKYKKKDGTEVNDVCFVDVTAFGSMAETINKYLVKGDPILIDGRLSFNRWEYEGKKFSKHLVIVESFKFSPKGEKQAAQAAAPASINNEYDPNDPDDIPF